MKADSVRTIFYARGANLAIAAATCADSGNQVLLLWGMKQAKRPPSPDDPLGWGEAVLFWSFLVAPTTPSRCSASSFPRYSGSPSSLTSRTE